MTTEPRDALEAEARVFLKPHMPQSGGQYVTVEAATAAMLAYRDQVRREVVEECAVHMEARATLLLEECTNKMTGHMMSQIFRGEAAGIRQLALSAAAPGKEPT